MTWSDFETSDTSTYYLAKQKEAERNAAEATGTEDRHRWLDAAVYWRKMARKRALEEHAMYNNPD